MTPDPRRIEELEAEVRYHRERYDLYKARMYGPRPATMTRLRELERVHREALARLEHARRKGAGGDPK